MLGGMDQRQSFLELMASMHDPVDPELISSFIAGQNVPQDEATATQISSFDSEQEQHIHDVSEDEESATKNASLGSEQEQTIHQVSSVGCAVVRTLKELDVSLDVLHETQAAIDEATGDALLAIPVPDELSDKMILPTT